MKSLILSCLLLFWVYVANSVAAPITPKTPTDVYQLALELKEAVITLRSSKLGTSSWPHKGRKDGKSPRHVLQKGLDVLSKINRLRVIRKMGEISIPDYPSRNISPDEVYDLVQRLVSEIQLIVPPKSGVVQQVTSEKTPNDVFQILAEISAAFDPILGVLGMIPGEVYAESERIVQLITFLRRSQNMDMVIASPIVNQDKHPNHALAASLQLLSKINIAEKHLWLEPILVPELPHQVIRPNDVFELLEVVVAELQRIKFRLGIERNFHRNEVDATKTSNDVVQNLQYATALMPIFPKDQKLVQYDPNSLQKTPEQVFGVTEHIIANLIRFRKYRGIMKRPNQPNIIHDLAPKHVYQKTLECIKKTNNLRKQMNISPFAVPTNPIRHITPTEVYELMVRLDSELLLIYKKSGMENVPALLEFDDASSLQNRLPSDVYYNTWQISYLLDTLLDSAGFSPANVYPQAKRLNAELDLIIAKLPEEIVDLPRPPFQKGLTPRDVYKKTHEVIDLINKFQRRAGMFGSNTPKTILPKKVTPSDVFNEVGVAMAELIDLKIFFGINQDTAELPEGDDNKVVGNMVRPSHVYQQMTWLASRLRNILDCADNCKGDH